MLREICFAKHSNRRQKKKFRCFFCARRCSSSICMAPWTRQFAPWTALIICCTQAMCGKPFKGFPFFLIPGEFFCLMSTQCDNIAKHWQTIRLFMKRRRCSAHGKMNFFQTMILCVLHWTFLNAMASSIDAVTRRLKSVPMKRLSSKIGCGRRVWSLLGATVVIPRNLPRMRTTGFCLQHANPSFRDKF